MDKQIPLFTAEPWIRLVYMVLFGLALQVAAMVMWFVIVVQFIFSLFNDEPNEPLQTFANTLAQFIYQCWQFLSYNTNEKPFPFADWPQPEVPADVSTKVPTSED